ncbi:MAG: hypothetical protein ACERKZ_15795 [Lachnotalea sp.]
MRINAKRILFMILLGAGTTWNLLCLIGIFSINGYEVSLFVIGLYSLFICFRDLFPTNKIVEFSNYINELSAKEKINQD